MADDFTTVIGPAGVVKHVRTEELPYLPPEWTPEDPEEAERRKYSSLGQQALAFAGGRAQGALLGAGDVVGTELAELVGGEELREKYAAYRVSQKKYAGGAELAGQVEGALGTAIVTGGLGLGAGAARLLGSRVGGMVAVGALEGGVESTGSLLSEAALGQTDLTGEKLAMAFGTGATLGGALGAGFAGGGALVRRMSGSADTAMARGLTQLDSKALSEMAEGTYGHKPRGIGGFLLDKYAGVSGALTGRPREQIANFLDLGVGGKAARDTAFNSREIVDGVIVDLNKGVSGLHGTNEATSAQFRGMLKEAQVDRVMKRGNELAAMQRVEGFVASMRLQLDDMTAAADDFAFPGARGKLLDKLDGIEAKMYAADAKAAGKAGENKLNTRLFMHLDQVKRDTGKLTAQMGRKRSKLSEHSATFRKFEGFYEQSRKLLEDENLWGGAADIQKAINPHWAAHIQLSKKTKFGRHFEDLVEDGFAEMRPVISRNKVAKYAEELLNPEHSEAHTALMTWLDTNERFVRAARDNLDLSPGEVAAINRVGEQTKRVRGLVDKATDTLTKHNQLQDMAASSGKAADLGTIGALIAGAPGAAIGKVVSALSDPASMVRQIHALQQLTGRVSPRIKGAVRGLMTGAKKVAKPGAAARAVAPLARRYEERSGDVRTMGAHPEAFQAGVERSFMGIRSAAPGVYESAVAAATARQEYLSGLLPPANLDGSYPAVSKTEQGSFMRAVEILDDPPQLLVKLGKRDLTFGEVEAVQTVWPKLYEEMQSSVMQELAALQESGKTLPYRDRVHIGMMIGIPTDPTLNPQAFAEIQASYATAAPEPPPSPTPGPSSQLSDNLKTDAQRVAEGAE